jgi:Winged helix DNA-binding domain
VKAPEIAQWRMYNTGLWGDPAKRPEHVVARLGAMQAQEFSYAKWSIAQRSSPVQESEIDRLFDAGAILRTHVLRPTWHFVAPEDIRWMLHLTAPRVKALVAAYERQLELDDRVYARTNRILENALQGGKHATRKDLVAALKRSKVSGTAQRFGFIFMRAELDAVVCSGALLGKQQTYALLDERVSKGNALKGDEALAELTRRYFTTRGPATLKDFSWWSSLKIADCRRGVQMIGKQLECKDVDDRTYCFERGSAPPTLRKNAIDLVQVYDECVVSYTLSRDALTATVKEDTARDVMLFWHPILLGGQVTGRWRRGTQGRRKWLETFLYGKLTKNDEASLDAAIRAYENFAGGPIEVRPS